MKNSIRNSLLLISLLISLLASPFASAGDALINCYSTVDRTQFFVSDLEEIAQEGATPVLLLNAQNQVVGYMSVTPERDGKGKSKNVVFNKIELCSTLETDSFSYVDGESENLLNWLKLEGGAAITQDEGYLDITVKEITKRDYASLVRAEYKAYDVFNDEDTVNSDENRQDPDFIEDWGLPKGKGELYFYIPANWSLN